MIQDGNIYYRARAEAAQREPVYASRVRAAERVYVSAEALADYESGATIPPCDVVARMIEVYDVTWLRGEHLRRHCPLLAEAGGESGELQTAALAWTVHAGDAAALGHDYAALALDGRVSAEELPTARAIRAQAVDVMRMAEATISALDRALRRCDECT